MGYHSHSAIITRNGVNSLGKIRGNTYNFSNSQLEDIISSYQGGTDLGVIACKYGVSTGTIESRLVKAGVPLKSWTKKQYHLYRKYNTNINPGKQLTLAEINKLCQNYLSMSMPILTRKFGISEYIVRKLLVSNGIKIRTVSEALRVSYKTGIKVPLSGKNHPNWAGDKAIGADGYIRVVDRTCSRANKEGRCAEHVAVWERVHRKILPKGWVIHHLNGIKTDNRPENLEAMPIKKHSPVAQLESYKQRIRGLEETLSQLKYTFNSSEFFRNQN